MEVPKGEWLKAEGRFVSGDNYVIGKVAVAAVYYDGARSKGDQHQYRCASLLPGQSRKSFGFATISEAKAKAEKLVSAWFRALQTQDSEVA